MADIKTIGVVGAGQMGTGITHVCALAGYDVVVSDVSQERLDLSRQALGQNLARQAAKGAISQDQADAALKRVKSSTDLSIMLNADLVVEAATEDERVKRAIFADLQSVMNKNAFLATNTSSLSVTRLAAATDRPDRFIGLHFMNPVPVMKLVELIRGIQTSDETYEAAKGLVERLEKTHATAEDFPAFIVNRILMPMINEAVYALYEGVGTVESIDRAMRLGANHPMGPLELADFVGLDTVLAVMRVLHEELADTKYRPCPLLVKYVEAGWLGRKADRGFYDYRGEVPVPTR
jgi:3-hydroxybutyryl-CoA dehydrogenase